MDRRTWLGFSAGAVTFGLGPRLLRADDAPTTSRPIKSCIFVFLYGGPSHFESFDPKPEAPAEVRGEFGSIATVVPGVRLSEHLPLLSTRANRFALIRGMRHEMRFHDSASCNTLTGRAPIGGDRETFADTPQTSPSYGAALSYMWRHKRLPVCHAALPYVMNNEIRNPGQTPGLLGPRFGPLQIEVDPTAKSYQADALRPPPDVPSPRQHDRYAIVESLNAANSPGAERLRPYYERALALGESQAVREALDLSKETPETRERYGLPWDLGVQRPIGRSSEGFGVNMRGQNFLLARRLVEAGVPYVNVYDFKQQGQNWDTHQLNFVQHKDVLLPPIDKALSALIDDLVERDLFDSTLIVVTGEFGRTPKINKDAGRDHWPDCYSVLLAGGGTVGGAVHGASDRNGAYPARDATTPADLAATIHWRFGHDPATELRDATGRPSKLADGQPLTGLFS